MKWKLIAIITTLFMIFATAGFTAGSQTRFLVKSHNPGLQRALGVSHFFDEGFTTDLSPKAAKALELLGVEVEAVPLWHVLAPLGACSPWPECKNGRGDSGDSGRTALPSDQTPWGIETVYNDSTITSTSGGAGVDVAVLDTGVEKHLDLKNRFEQCKDFTKGRTVKNGCGDSHGHGTHVAGIALADGGSDGKGVYGMAPDADLFAYKVCGNDGFCWTDDISTAIRHAADQGAEIVSMSLGGDAKSSLITGAVAYAVSKGVFVVAAAGNDGPDLGSIDYPGADTQVVAVGAIDSGKNVPTWSSRGVNDGDFVVEEREVEFSAPGVQVESTWLNNGYKLISGTSMATPHVSGLAAKLWQGSAAATRDHLHNRAEDIWDAGDDPATGFGLPLVG